MTQIQPDAWQSLIEDNPELREKMIQKLEEEREEIDTKLVLLRGEPKKTRRGPRVSNVTDGRTHKAAILHVLTTVSGQSGVIRKALAEEGHPMEPATFGTTISLLCKSGDVVKEPVEEGSRTLNYSLPKKSARKAKPARKAKS